jgi:hypothetical protein
MKTLLLLWLVTGTLSALAQTTNVATKQKAPNFYAA